MEIILTIPKEYEKEFNKDKFTETLSRLKEDANCLAGNYEKETADMLITAFQNCKVLNN